MFQGLLLFPFLLSHNTTHQGFFLPPTLCLKTYVHFGYKSRPPPLTWEPQAPPLKSNREPPHLWEPHPPPLCSSGPFSPAAPQARFLRGGGERKEGRQAERLPAKPRPLAPFLLFPHLSERTQQPSKTFDRSWLPFVPTALGRSPAPLPPTPLWEL